MKLYQFIFIILLLSFNSFSQEKNNIKLFKTSKESAVVINDSIDLDKYKYDDENNESMILIANIYLKKAKAFIYFLMSNKRRCLNIIAII